VWSVVCGVWCVEYSGVRSVWCVVRGVWWCGGVVVWWCGGVVVWWCGLWCVVWMKESARNIPQVRSYTPQCRCKRGYILHPMSSKTGRKGCWGNTLYDKLALKRGGRVKKRVGVKERSGGHCYLPQIKSTRLSQFAISAVLRKFYTIYGI
jgi:hypothetical protein